MDVERKMGAVESSVAAKKLLQDAAPSPANRLQPRPEKTVVHDQQIYASLDRGLNAPHRSVDRCTDLRHRPGILHLQAVQRILPIPDFADPEMFVGVGND